MNRADWSYAPGSRVTLDGVPLADARVNFQPTGDAKEPGIGSFGKTNANGEYSLTLIDDEKLGSLLPNDVVLVEGRIDTDRRDRFAKPMYHVERAMRLVPKNAAP